jgi:hypothetical protein
MQQARIHAPLESGAVPAEVSAPAAGADPSLARAWAAPA